ncbi:MAG: MFS transporter [Dehalococcoidia bacterium]
MSTKPLEASVPATRAGRLSAFDSLRYRNYRLLWFGQLVSSSGDWMDQVALNWLVVSQLYDGRDAALPVAILNASRLVPILVFTPIGGVLADRLERRRLMFATQAAAMVMAFVLATLVATGLVEFWMVLAIALGRGVMLSFNMPARQSLISELVPREALTNAVALNSATLNLTRVAGPLIAAIFFLTPFGIAGAFYFNGATFVAVLIGLAIMDIPRQPVRTRKSMFSELLGGFSYINRSQVLRALVILATVPMVFGMPYQAMSAVIARDVLGTGGEGFGLLTAATGVGAVCGALTIASLPPSARKGRLMLVGLNCFGLSIIVFAASSWFALSLVAMASVGVCQQIYLASNNTLLQLHAEDEYRGRVMSTLFLSRGMVPLGTLIAGLATTVIGVQWALGAMASVLVVLALLTARAAPRVRAL